MKNLKTKLSIYSYFLDQISLPKALVSQASYSIYTNFINHVHVMSRTEFEKKFEKKAFRKKS